MGNLLAGLGLAVLGIIVFLSSNMFSRYPARVDGKPAYGFFWMRFTAYFLFAAGFIIAILGFM